FPEGPGIHGLGEKGKISFHVGGKRRVQLQVSLFLGNGLGEQEGATKGEGGSTIHGVGNRGAESRPDQGRDGAPSGRDNPSVSARLAAGRGIAPQTQRKKFPSLGHSPSTGTGVACCREGETGRIHAPN